MAEVFHVSLTGDQEVTPNQTQAHGEGTIRWNAEAQTATYHLHFSGVDFAAAAGKGQATEAAADDVTNFHTHNAARGEAGPVAFGPITPVTDADDLKITQNEDGSWDVRGKWETTDPAPTSIADFARILTDAKPGDDVPLYFNVHTAGIPTGEIRGQWVAAEHHHDHYTPQEHDCAPAHGWGSDAVLA